MNRETTHVAAESIHESDSGSNAEHLPERTEITLYLVSNCECTDGVGATVDEALTNARLRYRADHADMKASGTRVLDVDVFVEQQLAGAKITTVRGPVDHLRDVIGLHGDAGRELADAIDCALAVANDADPTPIPGPRFSVYSDAETVEDLTVQQMGAVLVWGALDAPLAVVREAFKLIAPHAQPPASPKPDPEKAEREAQHEAFLARCEAAKAHNARYVPQLMAERGHELRAAMAECMPKPRDEGHLWYAYRPGHMGALGHTPEHAWRALFEEAIVFCASTDTAVESFDDLAERVHEACRDYRLYRLPRTLAIKCSNIADHVIEQMLSGPRTMDEPGGAA